MEREMEYQKERTVICLDKDCYKGFNYAIISYGTHPCCYVFIPENHKFYGKDYEDIDIECHGGLTFAKDDLYFNPIKTSCWVIGWDYAHCEDYMGYYDDLEMGHKWTTQELQKEVKEVIEQLVESKN